MGIEKWLRENTESLAGKRIAVTGSTGGIGKALCTYLASLGADLVLVDRNSGRSEALGGELSRVYGIDVKYINADLEDIESVKSAAEKLKGEDIDVFIHNAGAYKIPRKKCIAGLDNVFMINFVSPYYMIKELLPSLRAHSGRVVVVGSIAHNYSKSDAEDVDFSTRKAASKVYGNAKRYLMFSLFELFKNERDVTLSVTHPGISFTGITNHYPKLIFAIIKYPMKVIFIKPKKAALPVLMGIFKKTEYHTWHGPRILGIWGIPGTKRLKTCSEKESKYIGEKAEEIYSLIK